MRTTAVLLTLLFITPPLALVVIAASLLGVKDRPGGVYQRLAHLWARSVCGAAGVRMRVFDDSGSVTPSGVPRSPAVAGRGNDHDRTGGVVYCSNHVSWFDVLSLAAAIPHHTFIAKRELSRIPIFGRAARAVGIVFIDRRNRKDAFSQYEAAAREVRAGKSVIVCPEGTRGYDYRLRPFKKGPFVLAISAGVPIVPTVVYGAREVQRKGRMSIRGGEVNIHFLAPVPTEGFTYERREELMLIVWQRMADFLRDRYGVESAGGPLADDPQASAIPTSFF
jgi:1-acyl-sn-glycerol-3-phosphate acyltransferase